MHSWLSEFKPLRFEWFWLSALHDLRDDHFCFCLTVPVKKNRNFVYFSLKWFLIVAFSLIGNRFWTHNLCVCNNEHLLKVLVSPISMWPFGVPFLKLKPFLLLFLSVHPQPFVFSLVISCMIHTRSSLFVTF